MLLVAGEELPTKTLPHQTPVIVQRLDRHPLVKHERAQMIRSNAELPARRALARQPPIAYPIQDRPGRNEAILSGLPRGQGAVFARVGLGGQRLAA